MYYSIPNLRGGLRAALYDRVLHIMAFVDPWGRRRSLAMKGDAFIRHRGPEKLVTCATFRIFSAMAVLLSGGARAHTYSHKLITLVIKPVIC